MPEFYQNCIREPFFTSRPFAESQCPSPMKGNKLDFLLATNVTLCGLHRDMPEQKLNLFDLSPCHVTEPGACATQIVGRNFFNADRLGEVLHDVPDDLFCQPISPNDPALIKFFKLPVALW
jgi:hypothetical protein